ncbi:MAG: hypothetical protein WCI74_20590 [Actinomycetes bacterium]
MKGFGALGLMLALVLSVALVTACSPKQFQVPDVVGKTVADAATALGAVKLTAGSSCL